MPVSMTVDLKGRTFTAIDGSYSLIHVYHIFVVRAVEHISVTSVFVEAHNFNRATITKLHSHSIFTYKTMPSVNDSLSHDSASVAEALSVMIEKEQTIYKSCDYLSSSSSSVDDGCNSEQVLITQSDRQLICDWCYSIVDACQFDRETVALVSL